MELRGSFTAIVTPFTKGNYIDFNALYSLIEKQISAGVKGIVVGGSTGEGNLLSNSEFQLLVQKAHEQIGGRIQLWVGISGAHTIDILERMALVSSLDFEGWMISSPMYVRSNDDGIYSYFENLANNTSKSIMLYNIPSRTGSEISNEVAISLFRNHSNIVGIKEASGNQQKVIHLINNKPKGFSVLCGDDSLVLSMMVHGASGAVSVVGNVIPLEFTMLVDQCLKGDFHMARQLFSFYHRLIQMMDLDTNPIAVKAALYNTQQIENQLRLPLLPLKKELNFKLHQELLELGLLEEEASIDVSVSDFESCLN